MEKLTLWFVHIRWLTLKALNYHGLASICQMQRLASYTAKSFNQAYSRSYERNERRYSFKKYTLNALLSLGIWVAMLAGACELARLSNNHNNNSFYFTSRAFSRVFIPLWHMDFSSYCTTESYSSQSSLRQENLAFASVDTSNQQRNHDASRGLYTFI